MSKEMRELKRWLKAQNHEIDKNGKIEMHNGCELTVLDNTIDPDVNFSEYKFKVVEHESRCTIERYHSSVEYIKCLCIATGCEGEFELNFKI